MAINHLSNSLYWFEVNSTGSQLMEMSLISNNNVSLLFISSDDFFPFRLAVLQSYFLVTSVNVSKLVLINRVDYSVIMSSTITPYFALALIAPIQQPTESKYGSSHVLTFLKESIERTFLNLSPHFVFYSNWPFVCHHLL